jgi:hypothetical protein
MKTILPMATTVTTMMVRFRPPLRSTLSRLTAAFSRDEDDDELGEAKMRDPEYTPFNSPLLNSLSRVAVVADALRSRSLMYAVKAGVLTALTTLPNFVASVWMGFAR